METGIALMAEQLTVKFVEVQDRYPCNEDIECKYATNNYKLQDGDRIAIFKMGWKSLKNYILFEWAMDLSPGGVNSVIFSRYDLPNSQDYRNDLYQFCYISGENVVQGISTPFQIYSAESKTVNLTDSLKNENKCAHLKQMVSSKDKEILKLKEENAILRESLKALVDQRQFQRNNKCYDDDINELKDITKTLKSALLLQQKEIDCLKLEMKKDKADYKNLMLEKIMAERKFEAISSVKEASSVKRTCTFDFDVGNLQPLPSFPFDGPDKL